MKFNRKKISGIISELEALLVKAGKLEKKYERELAGIHDRNRKSALNLIHYLALRDQDLRHLQKSLGGIGVSRLGRAESHVLASIIAVRNILMKLAGHEGKADHKPPVSMKTGSRILKYNTGELLGKKIKGSKARIMVTLPSEAAHDYELVKDISHAGMDCARINCAHDAEETWESMIRNIRKARKSTGRSCRISMDLGGPKLRTGRMKPGPKVIHLAPDRDYFGRVISPATVMLAALDEALPAGDAAAIPVSGEFLAKLKAGDRIDFIDTRGKKCQLEIQTKEEKSCVAHCSDSAYITTGTVFRLDAGDGEASSPAGELPPVELKITLFEGDPLIIHRDDIPGEPAELGPDGRVIAPAHISCTMPEIFQEVMPGEPIKLDDGAIEGVISSVNVDRITATITNAKEEGSKLRADKGINLPESRLSVSGITQKDRKDLTFIAKNADIVNISFVNSASDIVILLDELKTQDAEHLGVIIKVETKSCLQNLPEILLTSMRHFPVGVMIARGDLAIECGWKNLAEIQEDVLWLCESAHVPIVWATQVLESLAKKGIPSRAEITDAAMAERAECVMLNKGPHIVETIRMLDEILRSMQDHHDKKAPMLSVMKYLNKNE